MPPAKLKILIVDDEPKNLIALESLLEGEDRELIRADSGFDALRRLLDDDYALIILDVRMPDIDGFETAELIRERERSRHTPIIFLTAAARGEFPMARGYALGAVDYIIKPVDPDVLRFKVAVFADLYRKTAQVKEQAEEMWQARAFVDSVLEGVTEHAIAALDGEGRVLVWNEGARRIYGYPADRMVGRHAAALAIDGSDAPDMPSLLRRVDLEGRTEVESVHVSATGRRFPALVTLSRRTDEAGAPAGYVFVSRDLTAYKQADEARSMLVRERAARAAAEAAQRHLQQLIDVFPEAILITDADGRLTMTNAVSRDLMGEIEPGTDMVHGAQSRLLTPDGTPCISTALPLARALDTGDQVRGEQLQVRAVSGEQVPVLVSAASVSDAEGRASGGVMVLQDISVLRELDRQKDDFLATVAHDLKTPLTIISGNTQLLERRARHLDNTVAAPFSDLLRSTRRTTRRAATMVDELLDITRIQMRRPLALDRTLVDLAALASDAVTDLMATSERHEIRLQADEAIGTWDRDRLYRVISNLIENAVKFSPDGGPIDVCVARVCDDEGGPWCELSVRDQGVGIPPEELPLIFERFYRASNVSGRIHGSGIGLTAARQIVEAHGGSVSIDSTPGAGTRVALRLPVAPEA
ncbi:MAG: ATP-binding protein [Dehalococcoidia bacterium]